MGNVGFGNTAYAKIIFLFSPSTVQCFAARASLRVCPLSSGPDRSHINRHINLAPDVFVLTFKQIFNVEIRDTKDVPVE